MQPFWRMVQKWLVQKFQGIAEYDDFWAPIIVAERELIGEGVALSSPPVCYSRGKKGDGFGVKIPTEDRACPPS